MSRIRSALFWCPQPFQILISKKPQKTHHFCRDARFPPILTHRIHVWYLYTPTCTIKINHSCRKNIPIFPWESYGVKGWFVFQDVLQVPAEREANAAVNPALRCADHSKREPKRCCDGDEHPGLEISFFFA